MLVLSRQRDESIMIGDNIVITIVDIRGDSRSVWASTPPARCRCIARRSMRPFSAKTSVPAASIPKIFEGWLLSRPLRSAPPPIGDAANA